MSEDPVDGDKYPRLKELFDENGICAKCERSWSEHYVEAFGLGHRLACPKEGK